MTAKATRKDYPLSMRLPEADIAMIDRAASMRGRSRTDFVREQPCQFIHRHGGRVVRHGRAELNSVHMQLVS